MGDVEEVPRCPYCWGRVEHGTSECPKKRWTPCENCGKKGVHDCRGPEVIANNSKAEGCLVITNIPSDASEGDFIKLFRPYGLLSTVVVSRSTPLSPKLAFVRYHTRDDALKACQALNAHIYRHLPMSVEMLIKDA